jgi:pyridoxine 5-phosphate synthase
VTVLSVNVNKFAVLRNSRGGDAPDPVDAARAVLAAGVLGDAEYNIEGNPFAPARGSYPGLVELARSVRPAQVTLVPDGDAQITSDHGFDIARDAARLASLIAAFKAIGSRVSLFMDAGSRDGKRIAALGADRIEIYTGPYAHAFANGEAERALDACRVTAEDARAAGLGVNAGHDLSQKNLDALLRAVPWIDEVSIGHALIGEAIYEGLATTVGNYLAILREVR